MLARENIGEFNSSDCLEYKTLANSALHKIWRIRIGFFEGENFGDCKSIRQIRQCFLLYSINHRKLNYYNIMFLCLQPVPYVWMIPDLESTRVVTLYPNKWAIQLLCSVAVSSAGTPVVTHPEHFSHAIVEVWWKLGHINFHSENIRS